MATKKVEQFQAVGRRKSSIARVRLIPNGTGKITINKRDIDEYFSLDTFKLIVRQPLELVELTKKVDIIVNVAGGGLNGQAGAIRLGIARNLVKMNENLKKELKEAGFLTRDARAKERKKPGLKKARRAPQFSKR
jgi:small subunit ribosomal protein S9